MTEELSPTARPPTVMCFYCEELKARSAFNREHVLQDAFGRFDDNLVLKECVCLPCNDYFGRVLDLPLARDTKEGLDRFEHGLVERKKGRTLRGERITLRQRGGRLDGAFLDMSLGADGTSLEAVPARQVGFGQHEDGPFEWRRLDALPDAETVREKRFSCCVLGGIPETELDDVRRLLAPLMTIDSASVASLPDPRDADGKLDTRMSGTIDTLTYRAIAKIAFNYLIYTSPEIAALDQFRPIRRFIRYGELDGEMPVRVLTKRMLAGVPEEAQLVAHIVGLRWDPRSHRVIGQVSLFDWIQYEVVLSTARFDCPPYVVSSGHLFNPIERQIAKLTTNPALARSVPMVKKG